MSGDKQVIQVLKDRPQSALSQPQVQRGSLIAAPSSRSGSTFKARSNWKLPADHWRGDEFPTCSMCWRNPTVPSCLLSGLAASGPSALPWRNQQGQSPSTQGMWPPCSAGFSLEPPELSSTWRANVSSGFNYFCASLREYWEGHSETADGDQMSEINGENTDVVRPKMCSWSSFCIASGFQKIIE